MKSRFLFLLLTAMTLNPQLAEACACGCGVFDVGTASMIPNSSGNMAYFEFNFMDQNQNRSGASKASADDNPDRQVRTLTTTLGFQTMFNREFGVQVDAPYVSRRFQTFDSGTSTLNSFDSSSIGDIRVRGIYSGFSADMSTGITFGLKLPTGKTNEDGFDADTQIGSGSTDLLVGVYHFGTLSEDRHWNSFVQANLNLPVLTQNGYLPGHEIAASYGVFYSGINTGSKVRIRPMAHLRTTLKASDHGSAGHADDTGYQRLLVAPALEFALSGFRIYTDAALPIYEFYQGNQLAAPLMLKTVIAYSF